MEKTYVIMRGSLEKGFGLCGPFKNYESAAEYDETNRKKYQGGTSQREILELHGRDVDIPHFWADPKA